MDKIQFKVKFFGTKERKGQIKQQATVVMAESEAKVETLFGYKVGRPFTV